MDKEKVIKGVITLLLLLVSVAIFAGIHRKSSRTLSDYANENPEVALKIPEPDNEDEKVVAKKVEDYFYYETLSENMRNYITGISYPLDDSNIEISIDDLRLVHVLYVDFDRVSQQGEIICNASIAKDLVEIFYELYINKYQIEKISLIENYKGDDEASMADNNCSCFNYRTVVDTGELSNHALGLAIDINPFYNPYVVFNADGTETAYPAGSEFYADRSHKFSYKIDENDLAYKLFTAHGFTWGGNWNYAKDYQHFEKVKK